ncbi:MAG: AAA family ATPase [Bacteroidetes bacterium]|nr:AAA family ATPase [Bacteroidota bacterium]
MKILNHFRHINLTNDQRNALEMLHAFLESDERVFILQGYAGSGKTTLLTGFVEYLESLKKKYQLMAPTGRAAKIIRDKTKKEATTIHRGIYNFERLDAIEAENERVEEQSYHYVFPINQISDDKSILIIDEASMISSKESKHELFTFGTGFLLNDLLTYAKVSASNNKLIFVGDPAQLQPVGDNKSLALDPDYFSNVLNLRIKIVELTEVVRQNENLILKNAEKIRNLIFSENRKELKFDYDSESFVQSNPNVFYEHFVDTFPSPKVGDGIIIAYSNGQCFHNNIAIREKLFPNQKHLVVGDIILINNNNYHTYGTELFNGDLAQVVEVNPDTISQSAPVMVDKNGKKERIVISLMFKWVKIRLPHFSEDISCLIHYDLLNSVNRDLSIDEMKAVYINFLIRFNEKQKERKEKGLNSYKIGSEEFKNALKSDPFFNALKIKYGYSITCHKSQGGEWEKVFVDYSGRVSLKTEPLKWCYTATTRARESVICLNAPNFGVFSRLNFNPIGQIGNFPTNAFSFLGVKNSPFHNSNAHKCKSIKYWEIYEKLENTHFKIENVFSPINGFLERYFIRCEYNELIQLDGHHNGAGYFTQAFKVTSDNDHPAAIELAAIFNAPYERQYLIDWNPAEFFLKELHSYVLQACDESKSTLTNVVKTGNYDLTYYFITDSVCSYIQFYFNGKNQFTSAMPKKIGSEEDEKLKLIISNLETNAS